MESSLRSREIGILWFGIQTIAGARLEPDVGMGNEPGGKPMQITIADLEKISDQNIIQKQFLTQLKHAWGVPEKLFYRMRKSGLEESNYR